MTEEEYRAAIEQYKAEHSAGGSLEHGEWKRHKYIRIENGRYIYPDDLKKNDTSHVVGADNGKGAAERAVEKRYGETRKAGRQETVKQQAINNLAKTIAENEAKARVAGSNDPYTLGNDFQMHRESTYNAIKKLELGKRYGINEKEVLNAAEEKAASGLTKKEVSSERAELKGRQKQNEAMKEARTATEEYKKQAAEAKEKAAIDAIRDDHLAAAKAYQDAKDREAKKAQQARQEETKKITSMTPEEARKRADELTKQNTPEKKSEAPAFGSDKYTPIKPENMTKEQLDAFKEMSREYMEGMEYSAKKYQQENHRPTKVVVTKTDPYTGAPTAAKVTYIDNNGHEQDTGYFFKDLNMDATPDNLQRRIDNNKKEKKIQHSYTDPKSFYAAVYDYKQAHKR